MIKYILISESLIGIHAKLDTKNEFSMYAMKFPIKIVLDKEKRLCISAKLKENKALKQILADVAATKDKKVKILVGFDLDDQGELMSEAVKDALIAAGISEVDIFRAPLTEKGYVVLKRFSITHGLKMFLYAQQLFQNDLKKNGLPIVGLREAVSLTYLTKNKGNVVRFSEDKINRHGASTVTAVQNYIMGDAKKIASQKEPE